MSIDKKDNVFIYNSMTRKKEKFEPVVKDKVKMYCCGPTVYNHIHIGNARPLIIFDAIRKFLKYLGYDVSYVQNITDIDDKIIKKANEEGVDSKEISKRYAVAYNEVAKKLGAESPDFAPLATKYLGKMIGLIKKLVDEGYAYNVDGNVFFEVSKFDEYGKLSKKDMTQMEIGDRVTEDIQSQKKDPVRDFALWKTAKPGEPFWNSPWGKGRPGWHTECVVMSRDILGKEIDIHTGGIDLLFPHHENEIAQAECTGGENFAKYWMHNEFVNIREEKMSKSLGNVVLAKDLAEKFSKEAIRLFFFQTHYRKKISFDTELVQSAENAVSKMKKTLETANTEVRMYCDRNQSSTPEIEQKVYTALPNSAIKKFKDKIVGYLSDDYNTPNAIAELFNQISIVSEQTSRAIQGWPDKAALIHQRIEAIKEISEKLFAIIPKLDEVVVLNSELTYLRDKRKTAREEKDWAEADSIKDIFKSKGIGIDDIKDDQNKDDQRLYYLKK